MTRAFALSAGLFALGVLGGVAWDERDVPPPERRDGYVVLEAEMHAHTRFSDGFLSPFDLVVHARRQGLHAIAVTEHNLVFPALLARWFSRATGGPIVLVGEEVTSSRYHVHAYGLRDRVLPTYDPARVIDAVHAQGGLVVAAHPVREFWPALVPVRERLDGAEIMHPIAFGAARGAWSWSQMAEFFEGAAANGHRLTAVGASDYHFFSYLGLCRTWIFAREATEGGVMEALRAGRTVVQDHRGVLWGDPARVAALRARPYRPKAHDTGYRGNGAGDRTARTLGWLGLVGMLAFRRRTPTA
ncbi:MAG: CehA/McbA family metallohydrolase [Polyangiales bacterium]